LGEVQTQLDRFARGKYNGEDYSSGHQIDIHLFSRTSVHEFRGRRAKKKGTQRWN
jgi:hypothetical protein